MKDYTSLVLNSDKCFESCAAAPSSPVISSYENLLRTPTPPKVTTIPEDILQVIFQAVFFFSSDTSFSKLDIHVISDVNYYLLLGYVLVWVLRKSKFWAARTFLTLPG